MLSWYAHMGKNSIHRVWYYLWFQATTGGLGKYPLLIKGGYCIVSFLFVYTTYQLKSVFLKTLSRESYKMCFSMICGWGGITAEILIAIFCYQCI